MSGFRRAAHILCMKSVINSLLYLGYFPKQLMYKDNSAIFLKIQLSRATRAQACWSVQCAAFYMRNINTGGKRENI